MLLLELALIFIGLPIELFLLFQAYISINPILGDLDNWFIQLLYSLISSSISISITLIILNALILREKFSFLSLSLSLFLVLLYLVVAGNNLKVQGIANPLGLILMVSNINLSVSILMSEKYKNRIKASILAILCILILCFSSISLSQS